MARLRRRLIGLAAVLAGLILGGLAALQLPQVRQRVLEHTQAYVERQFGLRLRASSLHYSLRTRSIELRNLSLTAVSAEEAFLQADHAVVVLNPEIFLGRISVDHISLGRPRLLVIRREDGTTNLPVSPASQNQQPSSPLQLGVVSVTGFSARLDDRAAMRSLTVGPFDLAVDTTGAPGALGPGAFTVRAGDVETSGTIAGRLTFDGVRVRVEHLTADTREGHFIVDGWADLIADRPAMSSHITAMIDLPQTARLARVDARGLTGRLDGSIDLTGPLAAPAVTLAVTSRDLRFPPLGPLTLTGRSSFGEGRAVIDTFDIASPAGSLHGDGTVGATSRLALRWANLRVDDLVRTFGASLPLRSGSLANGSGTVDFELPDLDARAWSRLRADTTTTLRPASNASGPDALNLSGTANLSLDRGQWSLRHSLRLVRANADLEGVVNGRLLDGGTNLRSTLGGRTRVRVDDVAALLPLVEAAGGQVPSDVSDGLHGSLRSTIDLDGTLDRPRAQMDIAIPDLRAQLLPHQAKIEGQLSVDGNGVRASAVRATTGTSVAQASGQYSWRGPLQARVELNQGNLSEIADLFHFPVGVSGSARLDGTLSGLARALHATFTLSARDLTVEQVSIGALTATGTVNLADGGLMKIETAAPALGARAIAEIVNRAGYPISGEITLDHQNVERLIPPAYRDRVGDLSGRLRATARGSGQLSNPTGIRGRIDIDALDATWRGTPLALATAGSVVVTGDRVEAHAIDLRVGQYTRATLAGQLGVTELPEALRFHLDGPLSELIEIASRTSGAAPVAVSGDGATALDVVVRGTLGHPLPTGALTVRSPSLGYGTLPPVTDLNLDANIDPTLITLRAGAARWQGASIAGEGVLPWRVVLQSLPTLPNLAEWMQTLPPEPSRGHLTIRADDVTPAVLTGLVAPEYLRDIQGHVSATLAADADHLSLDGIHATAVLDRASLTLAGVGFTQSAPTRITLEQARARIDEFRWTAEGNPIVATGGINLATMPASVDVGLSGVLDLRALGAFFPDVRPGGRAETDFRVTGSLDDPKIDGRIHVSDGELQWDSPRLAAEDLEGTVEVTRDRKVAVALVGSINTGNATLDGTLDLANPSTPIGNLQLTGRSVVLEYPSGLQTESNADLTLALEGTRSTLSGRIDVLGGIYREPLVLSRELLRFSSTSGIANTSAPPDWMSRLALNVAVATLTDVHVDNNYGRLDVGAAFRVTGTAANPGALGRLEAADGGEIFLGGNTFRIERLTIDLANPRAITPELRFSAQTRVGQLPIGIELTCPAAGPCERKVTSLTAGVDDREAEARLFGTTDTAAAGEALARLLSGEILGVVGRSVGLDALRLEQIAARPDIFDDPTLIAGDVDPAARLTLAKRVGQNVELVFSQNLADTGFTWSTTYFGPFGMSGRLLILDDQSRTYEFRHEPPIGAARTRGRPRAPGPRITEVRIAGTPGFAERDIRRQLRLTEGNRFTFGAWQRDRDSLERFFHSRNFLDARIRARRIPPQPTDDTVVLEYTIVRGPATQLVVHGTTLPAAVRARIVSRWASALFDRFLERDARTIVREHLYRLGYLQSTVAVEATIDPSGELKTLTIDVVQGSVVPSRVDVTGNAAVPTEQLLDLIKRDPLAAWLDPLAVERLIENRYRSEGLLAARATVGAPEFRDGTSVVTVSVSEGSAYSIGTIELSGLPPDLEPGSRDKLGLSAGARYQPANVAGAVDRLEAQLNRAAFRQSSVEVDTRVDSTAARVDIAFRVTPGPRSILRDVVVDGAEATRPAIARSLTLDLGEPLDMAAIAETRRRLNDLDVFRSVDVEIQPVASETPPSPGATPEQPVVARIALEERPRYRLRYGLAVNDENVGTDERTQRLGFAADLENRNVLGRGISAGFSLRLRQDQQVGRFSVGARRFFGLPLRSTVFVEKEREQLNPGALFPTTSNVSTVTAEQAYRVGRGIDLRYGYGFERNHTFKGSENPLDEIDILVNIARLSTSGVVDRRDDAFNPTRGWFASSAFELSTPGIGSDLRFMKDFAQFSQFVPFHRGLVFASDARIALARTPGDAVLIPSERFFAGGANSVRGYREDDLGPRSIFGDAEGGSAMLVLNGELRFPVFKRLRGVGFIDAGNVFPKVGDISLGELQVGAGAGARLDTPIGLLRFDLAAPVNGRPTDPKWRFHFGIGHAF